MSKKQFPNVIHVTYEDEPNDATAAWLNVRPEGLVKCDEDGQAVAVYKLVSVGKVAIARTFVETKRSSK